MFYESAFPPNLLCYKYNIDESAVFGKNRKSN